MKYVNKYIFLILFNLVSVWSFGQGFISQDSLRINLNYAFSKFEEVDSLYIEPELKQELILDYVENFGDISPERFNNKKKAEVLIKYYATSQGIMELIREFNNSIGENHDEFFSIGMEAYMKVYFNSDNPNALMRPNVLNKYALLIPKIEAGRSETALYLNSKYICLVGQAKNGIRIHSNKEYLLEFKSENIVYCHETVRLEKQERRIIICDFTN